MQSIHLPNFLEGKSLSSSGYDQSRVTRTSFKKKSYLHLLKKYSTSNQEAKEEQLETEMNRFLPYLVLRVKWWLDHGLEILFRTDAQVRCQVNTRGQSYGAHLAAIGDVAPVVVVLVVSVMVRVVQIWTNEEPS